MNKDCGSIPEFSQLDRLRQMVTDLEQPLVTLDHPFELPEPATELDLAPRRNDDRRQVKYLHQSCLMHSEHFRRCNQTKLVLMLKGYLSAGDTQNPYTAYLFARTILEFSAFLWEVNRLLKIECERPGDEWLSKGTDFHTIIVRARYATTDEEKKKPLEKAFPGKGAPTPIRIGKILERLEKSEGFGQVKQDYAVLCDFVHHNLSSQLPASKGVRMSSISRIGAGSILHAVQPVLVYEYPPQGKVELAIKETAECVCSSALAALKWINQMPKSPFSPEELKAKTGSELGMYLVVPDWVRPSTARQAAKIGRNAPCPCGSGRKYKSCCGA